MERIERLPVTNLPLSSLNPGFYLRHSGTSAAHVQLLVDAASSAQFPPIIVQENGLRIIDGLHRFEAAKQCGQTSITAKVVDCDDEEALVLAIKSNTLHGLPLTKADRVSGAKRILAAHPDWSDRAVAEVAGLSAKTVAVLRNRSAPESRPPSKRLGRDGKLHPVSGAEGRRRVADYIAAHPDATLRQIAKEVDVSLGTAHDVRDRLRRGVEPVHSASARPDGGSRRTTLRRATLRRPTWTEVSGKLASDPALRYTEGGRAFLRWMSRHAEATDEWQVFGHAIPGHWLPEVRLLADSIVDEWRSFADWLRQREEPTT
ncbi:MAG TPA: ParB N-terminal domain-containing protein [Streptosporangiaceae bacterium]|nr:ParB N-terminal domain-containing protein [Streptosporangiaceae bacterium]